MTPGNRNWRLEVGSKAEMVLLAGLLVAAAALVPLSHVGFRDALQALLQSFDIAVEQYARVSGTHWYDLELTATDNLTLERIRCRCPVVGTWKNGFIVLHDGQPRAVGKSEAQHHLLPVAARLIQGEPLRVVAERVAMQGHTLRWLVSRIDQSRPYYLLGEVEMPDGKGPALAGRLDRVDTYHPASYRGGIPHDPRHSRRLRLGAVPGRRDPVRLCPFCKATRFEDATRALPSPARGREGLKARIVDSTACGGRGRRIRARRPPGCWPAGSGHNPLRRARRPPAPAPLAPHPPRWP